MRIATTSLLFLTALSLSAQRSPSSEGLGKVPYLDSSLPTEARVTDLMRRMTLQEKCLQLINRSTSDTDADAMERTYRGESAGSSHDMSLSAREAAGLFYRQQQYMRDHTRLGIPMLTTCEGISGVLQNGCTIFPQSIAQGATWNPALLRRMTEATGREAYTIGIRQFLSPVLDIARELRWGRVEECFGEDPYFVGVMGTAFVQGARSEGVGCMPKHFVAHGSPAGGLNAASVSGGPIELRSIYAEPFRRVFRDAPPTAIMSCYSSYDGVPVSGSEYYLTDFLRDELGFRGFVYSDWGAVDRLNWYHHAVPNGEAAGRKALMAGVDMDVFDWDYNNLAEQVEKGWIDESYVDRACRRVLTAKFELGFFDDPFGRPAEVDKVVRFKEHIALAKEMADESIVLLENKTLPQLGGEILPLDTKRFKSIALLGPNSDYGVVGDYGWVERDHHECVTLYDGLKKLVGKKVQIRQAEGCDYYTQDDSHIAEAVRLAEESDLAIVAVGTRSYWHGRGAIGNKPTSGESFDLSSLELPGRQLDLLKAVKATDKPMVVVLITGRPLVMQWAKDNADAVVLQFYGGEQQGNALAEMLYGKVNPSGHLNVSFPRSTGNAPCFYNHYGTDREINDTDRGGSLDDPRLRYVFERPYALWTFGHGMSYTTFDYTDVSLSDSVLSASDTLRVSFTVRNTGKRAGKTVPQLYYHDLVSSVARPVQQLCAFTKVEVCEGDEQRVTLTLPIDELALYDERLRRRVEPGDFELQLGQAADNILWRKTITVK